MNTPAHLIFGASAFGKPGSMRITTAAVLGSLAPDISLYLMVSWSIFAVGTDPGIVFGQYYYSDAWQQVFAVDNSFIFWGMGLGVAIWMARPAFTAFTGAGVLHLAFDFPLHNHDARMHFWPLTDWTFVSPFSYWDSRFHADIVSPIEVTVVLILAAVLLFRFRRMYARILVLLTATAEIVATGAFNLIF